MPLPLKEKSATPRFAHLEGYDQNIANMWQWSGVRRLDNESPTGQNAYLIVVNLQLGISHFAIANFQQQNPDTEIHGIECRCA